MRARGGLWRFGSGAALAAALVLVAAACCAADEPPASAPALAEEQARVRERLVRLEERMLRLARLLEEREPENAERLREGLEYSGRQQLRRRVEQLIALLREADYGQAEPLQAQVLADLERLHTLLLDDGRDLDAQREMRERLAALRAGVQRLIEQQAALRAEAQRLAEQEGGNDAGRAAEQAGQGYRELERAQRELARRLAELRAAGRDLPQDADAADAPLERAGSQMRQAADRLGERTARRATAAQEQALAALQDALNRLSEMLRQVRREEREETLAALEARLRSVLSAQLEVRATVQQVAARPVPLSRTDELRLEDAAARQGELAAQVARTRDLLLEEGTTVVVPALLAHLSADMQRARSRLAARELSADTGALLDALVARLEELLAAVAQERARGGMPPGGTPAGGPGPAPLLPPSAELRLLRSEQVRINARTHQTGPAGDAQAAAVLAELAARQHELAALARQVAGQMP